MDFIRRGTIALLESGPEHDKERLHPAVFITEPFHDESNTGVLSVAVVPISTTKSRGPGDPTCEIKGGEHEFIPEDSWVNYARASVWTLAEVEKEIRNPTTNRNGKFIISQEPMKGEVLQRVYAGVCKSPRTPLPVRDFYQFAIMAVEQNRKRQV